AILPGGDAEHRAEGAQQAMRRGGGARAQRRQTRGYVGTGIDQPTDRADQRDARIRGARRPRVTAPAGSEPCPLGRLGYREERHLATTRLPARARRPAIDPRRPHGVHERAVEAPVAGQDGPPAARGIQIGNCGTGHAGELSASPCRDLSGFGGRIGSTTAQCRRGLTERLPSSMIYTVGHSTRSLETFLALLAEHQIRLLVDVRRYPASRRYPHFAQEPLAAALEAVGIAYRHDADLGGRRSAR